MSFRVRYRGFLRRQLASWHLPDSILVDIYLRLEADLSENPARRLERTHFPFDGMTYTFMLADRSNRNYAYIVSCQVKYGTDEETLWISRGAYLRQPL